MNDSPLSSDASVAQRFQSYTTTSCCKPTTYLNLTFSSLSLFALPPRLAVQTDAPYTPPTHAALSHLTSDPSLIGLVKRRTDTPSAMFISQGSHTGACCRLIAEFY